MILNTINKNNIQMAEVISEEMVIIDVQSALDVLMSAKYDAAQKILLLIKS